MLTIFLTILIRLRMHTAVQNEFAARVMPLQSPPSLEHS